jgi:RecA-family ATPase
MDLTEALQYIPPSSLDYQTWVNVGMALKHEGYTCDVWDAWSASDSRYKKGVCAKKWGSFRESADVIVTGGTIIDLAKKFGYVTPGKREVTTFDWEDEIQYDGDPDVVVKDSAWLDTSNIIEEPSDKEFDGVDELRRYIRAMYQDDEIVGFCIDAEEDKEKGKWRPSSKGVYGMTAGQILQSIKKHPKDIKDTIGDYNEQAGAWIRFNPLDGMGVSNDNVTAFRFALVESDSLAIEKQKALMEELKLPIVMMVHSGKKSVHAIVRIDAVNAREYRERVDYLYKVCEKNGLSIDKQNKNASRMSRMPGVIRGDKKQFIIAENIGLATFDEWKDYIEDAVDQLPDFEETYEKELPELAPELISGVLRKGHKMLISGPSKAGKSFLLIELALCITAGRPWLNMPCMKGKVLYINLEVDRASFMHRIDNVRQEMKIEKDDARFTVWNLRGENTPIDRLAPRLIRRATGKNYDAIIFDPLYKINQGDENSASEMGKFFNQLDFICKKLETSIICCHHHSKGSQGGKFSMDRASGSGVFARDPDALLDMIQINPRDAGRSLEKGQTAWRISYTLREFETPEDIDVIFDHPVHRITTDLKEAKPMSGADSLTNSKRGNAVKTEKKDGKYDRLLALVENWDEIDWKENKTSNPTLAEAVEYFKSDKGFSGRSIRRWIEENDDAYLQNGMIFLKEQGDKS